MFWIFSSIQWIYRFIIEADLNPWETIALENLSIESGASYAEIPSINGKKNIIFGSKNLINEATEIFGGDWKIK